MAHGGAPIGCGDVNRSLTDLRFFVYGVELRSAAGDWVALSVVEDGDWQQPDLAMIDLEDGSEACTNGTSELRDSIVGHSPAGAYDALRFTVGVPFDRNHADPLAASPPLDDSAMHWHWRSGYKFLRAGIREGNDGFWIHLGSTGCEGTVGDIEFCSRPNRVQVVLDGFDPTTDKVVFDLAALTAGTDLLDGDASDCVSSPAEDSCRQPFATLGLDFETGTMAADQRVFSVATK